MINPLQPGDTIALVAPSSPFPKAAFEQACRTFEDLGYRLAPGKHILHERGFLAGTEAERAKDLIHAVKAPEVAAIVCIRGGYGSSRLLPWLPFATLRRSPRIFLGYSDVTFLHLAFRHLLGWTTFHGPNFVDLGNRPEGIEELLLALSGRQEFSWNLDERQVLKPGLAAGPLIGGNLTCLCHLLGTPYFPDLTGALLMLEDRGEALYRLDRLLTQLNLAGVLDRIAGLVLGHFQECGDPRRVGEMVLDQVRSFAFPVVAGLPFGHGSPNEVVPLGSRFTLNTFEGTLKIERTPFVSLEARSSAEFTR